VTVTSSGTVTDTPRRDRPLDDRHQPLKLTYTAPNGIPASFTVNYTAATVQTAFACSCITDYPATSAQLVTSIVLPDNTSYKFLRSDTRQKRRACLRYADKSQPAFATSSVYGRIALALRSCRNRTA
jgi:hypothetical protein